MSIFNAQVMAAIESRQCTPDQADAHEPRFQDHRTSDALHSEDLVTFVAEKTSSTDIRGVDIIQKLLDGVHPWSTFIFIFGLFLVAFVLAIGHFLFFQMLDGTLAEHRRFEQSQVTAASLLITTVFKACLISAVGMSFAQHLWQVVRQKSIRVSRIEQLFHIRSSPLELAKLRVIQDAPLLFLMALSVWLIPIAVIYPPSALTVTTRPYSTVSNLNISILNPPPPPNFNALDSGQVPFASFGGEVEGIQGYSDSGSESSLLISYNYCSPNRPLISLAKLVLLSGEVIDTPSPAGPNSSYKLVFRAPQLSCVEYINNSTATDTLKAEWTVFNSKFDLHSSLTITQVRYLGWVPGPKFGIDHDYSVTLLAETKVMVCQPISVEFILNISYLEGNRQLEFRKENPQPIHLESPPAVIYDLTWPQSKPPNITDIPVDTPEFKNFTATVIEQLPNWNVFALLDASMQGIEYNWNESAWPTDNSSDTAELHHALPNPAISDRSRANFTLPNGTQVEGRQWSSESVKNYPTILRTSVFSPQRYNDSNDDETYLFDPRRDLVFTEDTLNDFITNVTISALTLNTWKDLVPVNSTEYRGTYHFSRPINLILPYALSLVFALAFVCIGTWSLVRNGVSAVDGGFLQIMAATTGRTEMERLANKHDTDGEGFSKELLDMKIRYGELLDAEGVGTGTAGFGLLEETRPLKRGWKSG